MKIFGTSFKCGNKVIRIYFENISTAAYRIRLCIEVVFFNKMESCIIFMLIGLFDFSNAGKIIEVYFDFSAKLRNNAILKRLYANLAYKVCRPQIGLTALRAIL